jgi:HK97 family phage prohead protease
LLKGGDLVVAGYASVEVVDKQGDKITKQALKDAFKKYMEDPKFRNVQLEVDDVGMFVVVSLRDDIEKAKEVAAEIRKGALRGFSIGGQAFKRVRKSDPEHGDYQEISKLELHEITICERGINPEATFKILKEDKKQNKVTKMTEDNDVMTQMTDVLSRLEGRLDAFEKGMPAGLKEHMEDKKDDKKEEKDGKEKSEDVEKSEEYSDVISSEYLDWMENTLKSAGVDIAGARTHFDDVAKGNLGSDPNQFDLNYGQAPNREQEDGKPETPKAEFGAGGKGKRSKVAKSDYLTPDAVSSADVEAAYEVYKAAMLEAELKKSLEGEFSSRYESERSAEITKAAALEFDARGPLDEIQKSIASLAERVEAISAPAESGETITKSAAVPSVEIPSTADLASMSWDEVHNLATKAFRGA